MPLVSHLPKCRVTVNGLHVTAGFYLRLVGVNVKPRFTVRVSTQLSFRMPWPQVLFYFHAHYWFVWCVVALVDQVHPTSYTWNVPFQLVSAWALILFSPEFMEVALHAWPKTYHAWPFCIELKEKVRWGVGVGVGGFRNAVFSSRFKHILQPQDIHPRGPRGYIFIWTRAYECFTLTVNRCPRQSSRGRPVLTLCN